MPGIDFDKLDELKRLWTDRFVEAHAKRPELKRFQGRVGRVVTVNYNGNALVDFADGAWYDIPASEEYLVVLNPDEARPKYDAVRNSAQAHPERQG
jgi:hypothetical protein